ncbi:hypothetical protein OESDEN_15465 [Oesophagostomum dentatum]|uniref:Uncharacterized protein n=1 Tax=Oesophagostomum dentatum TaxID=61180 RepID=A0A0B1SLQ1_OESDE|nr:hypothetical protein OESDEN_15465 [Oesophagostomum dentatum]
MRQRLLHAILWSADRLGAVREGAHRIRIRLPWTHLLAAPTIHQL